MDPLGILCQGKFLPDLSSLRCCPSGECTFDDSTGATLDETNFPFGRVLLLLPQRLRLGSNRLYIDVYTPEVLFGGGFLPVSKAATVVDFFLGGSFTIRNVCRNNFYLSQFCRIFAEQNHPEARKKLSVWIFPLVRLVNLCHSQVLSQMLSYVPPKLYSVIAFPVA